jgi:ATP synthase protein I
MSEQPPQPDPENLGDQVRRKQQRKLAQRRRRGVSLWFWLGMMGVVGWSVAVPAVLGTLLGAWADATWPGRLSWTLMGLALGVVAGCFVAWGWVKQHSGIDRSKRRDGD